MEGSNSKESVSNNSADLSNGGNPVEEPKQKDVSKGSRDERDQGVKPTSPNVKSEPVDKPSSSDIEPKIVDESNTSEEKLASPAKTMFESELDTELSSTVCKTLTNLRLSETDVVSISSSVAEFNERYLEQLDEANRSRQHHEAEREPEEVALRRVPTEARPHQALEQRDSVLTESGGDGFDLLLCGGSDGEENVEEKNLLRSRVLLGLLEKGLVFLQNLRFNAELLLKFIEERRDMAEEERRKSKDRSNSQSMPKFNLRPYVKGLSEMFDSLQPFVDYFIQRTIDVVAKYRLKSPELNEEAFKNYLDIFFALQKKLEDLEALLHASNNSKTQKLKIQLEIAELQKQTRELNRLLVNAHFRLSKIQYEYRLKLREMSL